jgi:hypothetical protein
LSLEPDDRLLLDEDRDLLSLLDRERLTEAPPERELFPDDDRTELPDRLELLLLLDLTTELPASLTADSSTADPTLLKKLPTPLRLLFL